jgi:hypothetical protein
MKEKLSNICVGSLKGMKELAGLQTPQPYILFLSFVGGEDKAGAIRMKVDLSNGGALKRMQELSSPLMPHLDGMVATQYAACGNKVLTIGGGEKLSNASGVAIKRVEKLAELQIPHLDGVVPTT